MSEMVSYVEQAMEIAGENYKEENSWVDTWSQIPMEVFARAAIEAMREPTEAMTKAAADEAISVGDGRMASHEAEQAWRIMIDTALR